MKAEILQFGDFRLDCSNFELSRHGHPLPVERKPLELLILLATRPGQLVTRAEIAATLWGSDVFVDIDSGINTAIRKIRHILRDDSDEPRFIQTVMGKGYRFVGVIQSSSPATPATNPGAPSSTTVLSSSKVGSRHRSWLIASAAAALLIVIATLGIRIVHGHTPHPAIRSIAVLPLDNLSGDPKQDYLADGMTDELITMLARDSTLRIVSRTSVLQYKGSHRPLPEIARSLHVDGVIEGSVMPSGGNVHVTAQLIGVPADTLLWAESYDRSAADAVRLPSEIALTVAARLHSTAARPASPPAVSAAAHDAYLRGRYIWFTGDNDEAGKYFRKATELQPDYALAWSGLSAYFCAGALEGSLDPRISVPQARDAALKALQFDDSLPEAHLALGGAYLCDWNLASAQSEIARAIQLNPALADAYHFRARIDLARNRNTEAIAAQRTAMELDPFERPWAMTWTLMTARQYDAAIHEAKLRLETLPNSDTLYWELGQVYDRHGDEDNAVQAWEKMETLEGHNAHAATLRSVYQRGGRTALLKTFIAYDEKQLAGGYVSPVELARFHAQLGEREQTLSLLEEALRQRSPQLLWIQTDPAFDFLHHDPRYQALVRQVGLPPDF